MISVLTPKCGNKVVSSIIKGDITTYYKMSEHMLMKDVIVMFFLLHMHDHNEPKNPALISSVWPYFRTYLMLPFSFLVFSLSFLPFLLRLFPNVKNKTKVFLPWIRWLLKHRWVHWFPNVQTTNRNLSNMWMKSNFTKSLSNLSWIESDVESHISAARDSVLLKPGLTDNAVKIKC